MSSCPENKPCDCIVGMKKNFQDQVEPMFQGEQETPLTQFNYCPMCGKTLCWGTVPLVEETSCWGTVPLVEETSIGKMFYGFR